MLIIVKLEGMLFLIFPLKMRHISNSGTCFIRLQSEITYPDFKTNIIARSILVSFACLCRFLVYLTMLLTAQNTQHRIIGLKWLIGRIRKEMVVACFKALSQHLPVETRENHIKPQIKIPGVLSKNSSEVLPEFLSEVLLMNYHVGTQLPGCTMS
jgi:hypothetical protein